jgi:hypothetical protein
MAFKKFDYTTRQTGANVFSYPLIESPIQKAKSSLYFVRGAILLVF